MKHLIQYCTVWIAVEKQWEKNDLHLREDNGARKKYVS